MKLLWSSLINSQTGSIRDSERAIEPDHGYGKAESSVNTPVSTREKNVQIITGLEFGERAETVLFRFPALLNGIFQERSM